MKTNRENSSKEGSCWKAGSIFLLTITALSIILFFIFTQMKTRNLEQELAASGCNKTYKIGDIYVGLAISEDGGALAILDFSKLMIFETETGKVITETDLHSDSPHTAISPDGRFAAAIQPGRMAGENTGDELEILAAKGRIDSSVFYEGEGYDILSYFLFSPDNQDLLYTAEIDGKVGIYSLNLATGSTEYLLEGYGPLFFSQDGRIMGTGGLKGIQLWTYQDRSVSLIQEIPIPAPVVSAAMSPDGKILAVATGHGEDAEYSFKVSTWDLPSGEFDQNIIDDFYVSAHPTLAFSPDSQLLAFVECEGNLYKVSDGTVVMQIDEIGSLNFETGGCVTDVVFSPSGDMYYYGSNRHLAECQVPPY